MRILFIVIALLGLAVLGKSFGCDIFLRHVDEYGVGVYAGVYFERNRPIEVAVGVPIPIPAIVRNELVNYMEGINSTHGVLLLGFSSMFNNVPRQDALTRKHNSFHPSLLRFPGNIESFDIVTEPIDAVYPGNQIFSHYGESWFEDRGMNEVVANTMSNSCPTQLVTLANNRLVAARRIFKGQVIEVARALLVPVTQALIESGPLASIAWYSKNYVSRRQHSCDVSVSSGGSSGSCSHPHSATTESDSASMNPYFVPEHSSTSDYAVILLGSGALYGALKSSHNDSEKPANVRYKWWSVDMIDPSAVDLDELILTEPLESLDASLEQATSSGVVCSTKMLMSFTALQTIEAGEELIVDIEEIVVDGVVYKTMNDVVSSSCV